MEPITTTRNVEKQNRKNSKRSKNYDLWGDVEQHGRKIGPTGVNDDGGEHDYDEDDDNEDV